MKFPPLLLLFAFLVPGAVVTAQGQATPRHQTSTQAHAWLQYFGTFRTGENWSVSGEVQIRRADFANTWQQLFIRTGVNHAPAKHVSLTGGYAYALTHPYGEQPIAAVQPEHRIWEQINVKNKFGTVDFENRFRLEQRFLKNLDAVRHTTTDGWFYQNRVRYRTGVIVPLSRRARQTGKAEKGDVFLNIGNEVFFNFGRAVRKNVLDQNRFSASVGYRLSPGSNVQVGYLHQYIQKGDGVRFESNHTLTVAFSQTVDLRKLFGKG